MELDLSGMPPDEIVGRLRHASQSMRLIPNGAVTLLFEQIPKGLSFPVRDWNEFVEIAAEQWGRWHMEFLFSPLADSNRVAMTEAEEWLKMWKRSSDALDQAVPEVAGLSAKTLRSGFLAMLLNRRAAECSKRPFHKALTLIQSTLAQSLFRLGFKDVGARLNGIALYPRGSVGRVFDEDPLGILARIMPAE